MTIKKYATIVAMLITAQSGLLQAAPGVPGGTAPAPASPIAPGTGIGTVRPVPPQDSTVTPVTPPGTLNPPAIPHPGDPSAPGIGTIPPNPTPPNIGSVVPTTPIQPVPPRIHPPVTPGSEIRPVAPDIGGPAVVPEIGQGSNLPGKDRNGPHSVRPDLGVTNSPTPLPNPALGSSLTNGAVRSIDSTIPRNPPVRGIGEESQTDKLP